jgi:hypothetical protein
MKRIIVYCPCGKNVIWSKDIDDNEPDFTVYEGIGDTQPCCAEDNTPPIDRDFMAEMKDVKPRRGKKSK